MPLYPRVTLAAVIQRDDKFLLVEEKDQNGLTIFNQPAGHLEHGESVLDGIKREVLEETGWPFTPKGLLGMYRSHIPEQQKTYIRVGFHGEINDTVSRADLDPDIIATHWKSFEEIKQLPLRDAIVVRCIEDHLAGNHYPLTLLRDFLKHESV